MSGARPSVSSKAAHPSRGAFTPGPWEASSRCVIRAGKVKIATADVWGESWLSKKANANLIASAPAMHAALAAFVDAWNDIDKPFQPEMPRLTKQAETALAKARGEQGQ